MLEASRNASRFADIIEYAIFAFCRYNWTHMLQESRNASLFAARYLVTYYMYIFIYCIYVCNTLYCVCVCKGGCILLLGITTDNFTSKTASAIFAGLLLKWQRLPEVSGTKHKHTLNRTGNYKDSIPFWRLQLSLFIHNHPPTHRNTGTQSRSRSHSRVFSLPGSCQLISNRTDAGGWMSMSPKNKMRIDIWHSSSMGRKRTMNNTDEIE